MDRLSDGVELCLILSSNADCGPSFSFYHFVVFPFSSLSELLGGGMRNDVQMIVRGLSH